ncbi:MAG: CBS domain-containing protein [Acetobacteraceae bacterium]|nr:CBS domain-containing protein [Acetobacteraceae bacterium]
MNREMAEIIRNQKPLTLTAVTTVQEACRRMHSRKIGAILVTNDKGALIGIFTGRDAVRLLARGRDPTQTLLKDVMTRKPQTMKPRATAIEALRLMRDGGFRHVPVVEEGVVLGIVSRGDFRGLEHDRMDEETGLWERMR